MTQPKTRIFDVRARRHADPQQLAMFASSTPWNDGDYTSSTSVGSPRNNPHLRHVLRTRKTQDASERSHSIEPNVLIRSDKFLVPIGFADELITDNFAGGGTSTGLEAAFGRRVNIAINHDFETLAMHFLN